MELTLVTFLPLLGMLIILFVPKDRPLIIKRVAWVTSLATLAVAVYLYAGFPPGVGQMQYEVARTWIPSLNISYHMGVDGISLPLVVLTALLTFLCMHYSLNVQERVKEYFVFFLLLETGTMGVFTSLDFFLFYIFWEVSLVPMYFIIGIWGHERREYAAIKFFLYTLAGSVLILLSIIVLYFSVEPHTFDMVAIAQYAAAQRDAHLAIIASPVLRMLVFWGLFIGFAIKVPTFPFHTWLPDAHVEAPTAGSVMLAGILLKMGTYAMLRVSVGIFPDLVFQYAPVIGVIALIGIIYGSLVAMAQPDLKKLVAYSSVAHMGFVVLGIASLTPMGIDGAVLQMFSHGLLTGALFFLVGVIYDRAHHRQIARFGGLGARVPVYAGVFVFIALGSLGLPGMSGFVSELFVLLGSWGSPAYKTGWFAGLAVTGIVLGAAYLLWTVQRVFLGPLRVEYEDMPDMNMRELVTLVPLMALTLLVGLWPATIQAYSNGAAEMLARLIMR